MINRENILSNLCVLIGILIYISVDSYLCRGPLGPTFPILIIIYIILMRPLR